MKAKNPFLSVVIPVFNESNRVLNLAKIYTYLIKQPFSFELIVVNDGSSDNTVVKLKELAKKIKFKLISYSKNKGKGHAIKTGMLNSKGQFRLFADVDLSTPIEEFDKFLTHLNKYDIIIGSRKLKKSHLIKRQPKLREYLGRVFTLLSKKILNLPLSDFTCGFKCFSQKASEEIFNKQTINRWGFDPEILFIGTNRKFFIKEVPVKWSNDPASKVKFPQDIFNSFYDLLKIKYNFLRGRY